MKLEKAVELLTVKYTYATSQKWIRNPLAWALYCVYKEADREGTTEEEDTNGQASD